MTLHEMARRLAEYRLARSTEGMTPLVVANTMWRDDGLLPSGDRFTVWLVCDDEALR